MCILANTGFIMLWFTAVLSIECKGIYWQFSDYFIHTKKLFPYLQKVIDIWGLEEVQVDQKLNE